MTSLPNCVTVCPIRSSSATPAFSIPSMHRPGPTQDVYINGGRIAALYETGSPTQGGATVLDAGGRTLLPALFDMHSHEWSWNAILQIAGGVTTVRDLGNDNTVLTELAALR